MPNRTDGALVRVIWTGSVMRLVPYNSEGKAALDAGFTADGSKTTVAIVQEDAVMSGYADASQPYKTAKFTFS